MKSSQYLRAAASLSSALDSEVFRICPFGAWLSSNTGSFLEAHRDHVAFVDNSDLCCTTIFVLHCLVDRFVAGGHHKSENTVTICEIRVQKPSRLGGRTGICSSVLDWASRRKGTYCSPVRRPRCRARKTARAYGGRRQSRWPRTAGGFAV